MQGMNSKNKKLKLITHNKKYCLKSGPLYKITSKKKLSDILFTTIKELDCLKNDSHYRVFTLNEKSREIQAPKFKLNKVHTRLASLLLRIEQPKYVHSGLKGRSYLTNAKQHVGHVPLLTVDIKNFYPSTSQASIYNFFHSKLNMVEDVSALLAKVCSYSEAVPTGSRVSMPLAFWCNYPMFEKLYNLSLKYEITMTVYVDDVTFSGVNVNRLFKKNVVEIIESSGMTSNTDKERLYKYNEVKIVTGVAIKGGELKVVNKQHKNIYNLVNEIKECQNDAELKKLQERVIGTMNSAAQIDPKYMSRIGSLTSKW